MRTGSKTRRYFLVGQRGEANPPRRREFGSWPENEDLKDLLIETTAALIALRIRSGLDELEILRVPKD